MLETVKPHTLFARFQNTAKIDSDGYALHTRIAMTAITHNETHDRSTIEATRAESSKKERLGDAQKLFMPLCVLRACRF
jgi:hypothetical protein